MMEESVKGIQTRIQKMISATSQDTNKNLNEFIEK